MRLLAADRFLVQQLYGTVQISELALRQIWLTGYAAWRAVDTFNRPLNLASIAMAPIDLDLPVSKTRITGRVAVPVARWKAVYVSGKGAAAYASEHVGMQSWQAVSLPALVAASVDLFPKLPQREKARRRRYLPRHNLIVRDRGFQCAHLVATPCELRP